MMKRGIITLITLLAVSYFTRNWSYVYYVSGILEIVSAVLF